MNGPRDDTAWIDHLEAVAEDRADEARRGDVDPWDADRRQDAYERQVYGP